MANKRKLPIERMTGVSITLPNWMVEEIDKRCGENGRSSAITALLRESLAMSGDEVAIDMRIREIDDLITRQELERERLESIKASVNAATKKLDDPLVADAIKIISQRAINYIKSEGVEMQDRAIRTMGEKYLKGPIPNGFIERVRAETIR